MKKEETVDMEKNMENKNNDDGQHQHHHQQQQQQQHPVKIESNMKYKQKNSSYEGLDTKKKTKQSISDFTSEKQDIANNSKNSNKHLPLKYKQTKQKSIKDMLSNCLYKNKNKIKIRETNPTRELITQSLSPYKRSQNEDDIQSNNSKELSLEKADKKSSTDRVSEKL